MKREAINHTKMDRLMRRLKIPRYAAVGILEMLWNFTARECPTGLLANRTPDDVAIACGWGGDEAKLVEALEYSRWVDRHGQDLVIHDWPDHCDNSVHLKLWKERQFFHDGTPPKPPASDLNSNVRKQYNEWVAGGATFRHGAPVGPSLAKPSLAKPSLAKPSQSLPSQAGPVSEAASPPEAPAAKPKQVLEMEPFRTTDGDLIVERVLNVCMAQHPIKDGRGKAREEIQIKIRAAPDPAALAEVIIAAHGKFCEFWKTTPIPAGRLLAWWIRDEDYLSPPQAVLSPVLSKTDQALKALWGNHERT